MRKDWNTYFMDIALQVATRSTCIRRQVGALIVRNRQILATGYNGSPMNCDHCEDIGCMRTNVPSGERHELCRAIHAEQNAIIQCAKNGVSTKDASIYITCQPCVICAKMIINAGIRNIMYKGDYPDLFALKLLEEAQVNIMKYERCYDVKNN